MQEAQTPINPVVEILTAAANVQLLTVIEQMLTLADGSKHIGYQIQLQMPGLSPLTVTVPANRVDHMLDNYAASIYQDLLNKGIELDTHLEQVRQAVKKLVAAQAGQ